MSNILKDLAPRYNLTVGKSQAWGAVDGYWFVISQPEFGSNLMKINTTVSLPDEKATAVLTKSLTEMMRQNREISCERKGGKIEVCFRRPSKDTGAMMIDAVLMRLVALFRLAGAVPACSNCGKALPGNFAMLNGVAMKLCSQCEADIEGLIAKGTEEPATARNNILKGLLGALLGALAGSAVWVAIGLLGYLAAIGGVAISFCSLQGFRLMKGKITIPALLIICLISIAAVVLAQFFTWDISVYNELARAGRQVDFITILRNTFAIPFENSDSSWLFIRDTLLGLFFLVLGGYPVLKQFFTKTSAPAGKLEKI